jgi:hypothetical protein
MFSLVFFGIVYFVLVFRFYYVFTIFITGVFIVCIYGVLLTCNCCEVGAFGGCLGLDLGTLLPMCLPMVVTLAEVVDVVQPLVVWPP